MTLDLPSSESLREKATDLHEAKDVLPIARNNEEDNNVVRGDVPITEKHAGHPSALRQNLFMIFITLTQLVQMIPLGVGINSGLAIGAALDAPRINSVWIVASYPLTQGTFVLIGRYWINPLVSNRMRP